MELTITFFIKFTLVVHFILALVFILLSLLRLNNDEMNRYAIFKSNFLTKIPHILLPCLFYPFRWLGKEL
ncbi:hypothetical protein QE431_001558 [Flavobacterium sp. SORGH_AS 622]|nr:hypothetical protein [Flavobacterium sp. SORGH_AS_0622]